MSRFDVARRRMVDEQLSEIKDQRVITAIGKVARERFLPEGFESQAYLDRPVKIGLNQTISQPVIVAKMTEALELSGKEKVLEIGTGSGYQTAILAELAKDVYSIERLKDLMIFAQKNLFRLRYSNIKFRIGDGTLGWPEEAPFDAIIVTAGATEQIPSALIEQLAENGKLIIPAGGEEVQKLYKITKINNEIKKEVITYCRFVKLIGEHGWKVAED